MQGPSELVHFHHWATKSSVRGSHVAQYVEEREQTYQDMYTFSKGMISPSILVEISRGEYTDHRGSISYLISRQDGYISIIKDRLVVLDLLIIPYTGRNRRRITLISDTDNLHVRQLCRSGILQSLRSDLRALESRIRVTRVTILCFNYQYLALF